ncbi:MCE family protein [Acidiferrimicrobium sp. IK]|uniref:MCE family protein n=1 Tax=Acidiferrimicrobium sp. IK TaxID=2871700 RepID=UPI0021CAE79F|nr:MCE family protein [Acidiferrimicrobium sp. IK]MCU4184186.1 MCE family protein [Acidiferrimicrobium sp. IK]
MIALDPPTAPGAGTRRDHDAELAASRHRAQRRRSTAFIAGVAFLAVLLGAVVTIVEDFNGAFSSYVDVRAVLPPGQPVDANAPVQYAQVPVGKVGPVVRDLANGAVEVTLRIKPSSIGHIPANVVSQVAPSSLFGTEAVILQAPAPAAAHLVAGSLIPPGTGSSSLQGSLTDLNNLLIGLHPAEIDTTLSALSGALAGQGPAVSSAIRALDSYLAGLAPQLPTLEGDVDLITPVLDGLSASVPALLDVASNAGTVAQTLTDEQQAIAQLMTSGASTSATVATLLSGISTTVHQFLVNLAPLLGDINGQPGVLPTTLDALRGLASALLPALSASGMPALSATVTQRTESPYYAFLAGADLPVLNARQRQQIGHSAFASEMDPPTYTAADCPRYGADPGPNCPTGSASAAGGSVSSAAGPSGSASGASAPGGGGAAATTPGVPLTAAQMQAAATAMTGVEGRPPAQPGVSELIMGTLLGSLAS